MKMNNVLPDVSHKCVRMTVSFRVPADVFYKAYIHIFPFAVPSLCLLLFRLAQCAPSLWSDPSFSLYCPFPFSCSCSILIKQQLESKSH